MVRAATSSSIIAIISTLYPCFGLVVSRTVSPPYEFYRVNMSTGGALRFNVNGTGGLVRHLYCNSLVWATGANVVIDFASIFNSSANVDRRVGSGGEFNFTFSPLIRVRFGNALEMAITMSAQPKLELSRLPSGLGLLAYSFTFVLGTVDTTARVVFSIAPQAVRFISPHPIVVEGKTVVDVLVLVVIGAGVGAAVGRGTDVNVTP